VDGREDGDKSITIFPRLAQFSQAQFPTSQLIFLKCSVMREAQGMKFAGVWIMCVTYGSRLTALGVSLP
jgi:hypothetical protein